MNHTAMSWCLFLLGFAMHFLLQAKASVKSQSNGLKTIREWLALTWPIAIVRLFLCAVAFGFWLDTPDAFTKALSTITGSTYASAAVQPRDDCVVRLYGGFAFGQSCVHPWLRHRGAARRAAQLEAGRTLVWGGHSCPPPLLGVEITI